MPAALCRLSLIAVLLVAATHAFGQAGDVAQQVYNSSQESVFLVYLNDNSGSPSALGTAFLVAPRILVTNAHVADAGTPVLAVGPVRIPLKVVRTDEKNDLAVLSVDIDLTSKALPLSSGNASPGQQIFAIGNPVGLEKTISQGIVAGIRTLNQRKLVQITSPISHGSSGGPILDSRGQVIAVAVGMLEGGQNLNFAVPVEYLRAILDQHANPESFKTEPLQDLNEAEALFAKRSSETFDAKPDSDYQIESKKIVHIVRRIADELATPDALKRVSCMGTKDMDLSDAGINAARKLVRLNPTSQSHELLSYVLYDKSNDEQFAALMAKSGSDEEVKANATSEKYLTEAIQEAKSGLVQAGQKAAPVATFVLGEGKMRKGEYAEAISLLSAAAAGSPAACDFDFVKAAYSSLITANDKIGNAEQAEKWFRRYAARYDAQSYDWDAEGDRRDKIKDYKTAAESYENAASRGDYYSYDYCYASRARYLESPIDAEGVLSDGRKCVQASVNNTSDSSQQYLKSELPLVYRMMADVLHTRGVEQPALEYVKESLARKPDDPFAISLEADILDSQSRYSECIAAAQAAIAASDGKYAWMHFRLGSCYFSTDNWGMAAASFQRAAEADRTDAVSAFNAGLSLDRQGFKTDARIWYNEALRRKPDEELRQKVLTSLR